MSQGAVAKCSLRKNPPSGAMRRGPLPAPFAGPGSQAARSAWSHDARRGREPMNTQFRRMLTRLGVWIAHPAAFLLLLCYVACWMIFDFKTLEWHAVATVLTLLMTLFI